MKGACDEPVPESTEERNVHCRQQRTDGARAWVVCISGMLSCVIVFGSGYSFGLLFPLLLDEFKEGKAKTAWVGSLAVSSSGLFAPITGTICKRLGPRLMIVLGTVLSASSLLLTTQVPSISWMYVTYGGLFGLGSSAIYMATFVEVPRHFIKRRSLATGMITMGPGGGLFVMSPVVQRLLDFLPWRQALMALAGIVSLCGALGCLYSKRVSDHSDTEEESQNDHTKQRATTNGPFEGMSFLKNPLYVSITLIKGIAYIGHAAPPVHLIRYSQGLGINADSASHFYMCVGLGSQLGRLITGRLCDRCFDPKMFLHLGFLLSGVSTLLLNLISSYSMMLLYSLVYGIADGLAACGGILSAMSCLRDSEVPIGFGINQMFVCLAIAGGPPLIGLIADTSSYTPAFYVAGGIAMFGVLAMFFTYHLKPAQQKSTDVESTAASHELLVVTDMVSVL